MASGYLYLSSWYNLALHSLAVKAVTMGYGLQFHFKVKG